CTAGPGPGGGDNIAAVAVREQVRGQTRVIGRRGSELVEPRADAVRVLAPLRRPRRRIGGAVPQLTDGAVPHVTCGAVPHRIGGAVPRLTSGAVPHRSCGIDRVLFHAADARTGRVGRGAQDPRTVSCAPTPSRPTPRAALGAPRTVRTTPRAVFSTPRAVFSTPRAVLSTPRRPWRRR